MRRLLGPALLAAALMLTAPRSGHAAHLNAFGTELYTIESDHFRAHYRDGLEEVAKRALTQLEGLYDLYANTYKIRLPSKTEVLVSDDDVGGGWALAILNMIHIWANDFDYNLRGTSDFFSDVVAHEYAHIASISASFKMPSWMPYIQFGYFSHPNNFTMTSDTSGYGMRVEAHHIFPSEVLPPWFFEGIAQYESTKNGGDRWDTHRDMILRTLVLTDKLLTWDHMAVFAGKGDDFEKTYNHGFSLVRYIGETYGQDKVTAILRESSRLGRLNFDRSIEAVLGMTGRELYDEWKASLKVRYTRQIESIGKQCYGKRINKDGFDNGWPRFGPGDRKVYFLSNGKKDYSFFFKDLYSYTFEDTVKEEKRIKLETGAIKSFYDIHDSSGLMLYSSAKSRKSTLPANKGGIRVRDLYIDTLPPEKKNPFARKTERQVSERRSLFHGAFSPTGDKIACSRHDRDRFYLCIVDTSGENLRALFPDSTDSTARIKTIYSLDWSPDGKRIALSYVDSTERRVAIYDTSTGSFSDLCNTPADERDPRFSPDGKALYFSSDRTGIFNVYRYTFATGALQKLTNVSGGAFTPDVSSDEKKLVYTNYDKDGFGIYLIDSIKVLDETVMDAGTALVARGPVRRGGLLAFPQPRRYRRTPRQFLLIPALFAEQILTEEGNSFKGKTDVKLGGVVNLNDPFEWAGQGTYLGAFFLVQPGKLRSLFTLDTEEKGQGFISNLVTYDFGVFADTKLLPFDISLFYAVRSLPGKDQFTHDAYGTDTLETLVYNLSPRMADVTFSHWLNRNFGMHAFQGYNNYKVGVRFKPLGATVERFFTYRPAWGGRTGLYASLLNQAVDSRMNISPKGLSGKLKYEYWYQNLQKFDKAFNYEGGTIVENYDLYRFHQLTIDLKLAQAAPWFSKHDIYLGLNGTSARLTDESRSAIEKSFREWDQLSTDIPSFFKPGAWLPGYAYYYRDTIKVVRSYMRIDSVQYDTLTIEQDTVLLSGNTILTADLSYRFPLVPGSIDKKLGFIYFDQLFGALNVGGGTAADRIRDFGNISREDILFYLGAELRLEALSFGSYPLALSFRWDYGLDRAPPIGGHRFSLGIGFSFENWDVVTLPDGRRDNLASGLLR